MRLLALVRSRVALSFFVLLTVAVANAAYAHRNFHLRLVRSEPTANESIASPKSVKLWFSEAVVMSVTSLKLTGADDANIALGKLTYGGKSSEPVEAQLASPLPPGRYTLSFKTASKDMHPVTGDIAFVVH